MTSNPLPIPESEIKPPSPDAAKRPANFVSLRWKTTLPLLAVLVAVAMVITFLITDMVVRGMRDAQVNALISTSKTTSERAAALGVTMRREADRVAFTQNVPELVVANNGPTLQRLVQPLAAAGDLDYVLVGNTKGREVVGLQRSGGLYLASQGAVLEKLGFIEPVLSGKYPAGTGIVKINDGYALFTAAPIRKNGQIMGIVAVGVNFDKVIQNLRAGSADQLSFYGPEGELLGSTLAANEAPKLDQETKELALSPENRVPIRAAQAGSTAYQAAYFPFVADSTLLGITGVLQPNTTVATTDLSRYMLSILLSVLVGGVVGAAFIVVNTNLKRVGKVTQTAQALSWGDPNARTNLKPVDEVGEAGAALDQYAQHVQQRQGKLEESIHTQRVETARLTAVISSLPDGIVVQDLDGGVMMMNDNALKLLGSERAFRSSPLAELTALVTDKLGDSLAPGVYSLGDPQRVTLDGKILSAQAAAVLASDERIGTVIVLRDATDEVRRQQALETTLDRIEKEANAPVTIPPKADDEDTMQLFIREVNRNSIKLQRMITEIRDLSSTDSMVIQQAGPQSISAEKLLWGVAQEWQGVARNARLDIQVVILRRDLHVLGEERRLRWAIGSLLDNAIKFTPPKGHITLMLRAEDDEQYAHFLIKDDGVGISPADLPNVFTRFFRGKPMLPNGRPLQTPGTGQGLFIAKRVIEAHGGGVEITSAVGYGTELRFSLPLTANVTLDLSDRMKPVASAASAPTSAPFVDEETVPLTRRGDDQQERQNLAEPPRPPTLPDEI